MIKYKCKCTIKYISTYLLVFILILSFFSFINCEKLLISDNNRIQTNQFKIDTNNQNYKQAKSTLSSNSLLASNSTNPPPPPKPSNETSPTIVPSPPPLISPSNFPSGTARPSIYLYSPTISPTVSPIQINTFSPTMSPTVSPIQVNTFSPTIRPITNQPISVPPTISPVQAATLAPTGMSNAPTALPTNPGNSYCPSLSSTPPPPKPTNLPSATFVPTQLSNAPSTIPTVTPSQTPVATSAQPIQFPTLSPSILPPPTPTLQTPTQNPTIIPPPPPPPQASSFVPTVFATPAPTTVNNSTLLPTSTIPPPKPSNTSNLSPSAAPNWTKPPTSSPTALPISNQPTSNSSSPTLNPSNPPPKPPTNGTNLNPTTPPNWTKPPTVSPTNYQPSISISPSVEPSPSPTNFPINTTPPKPPCSFNGTVCTKPPTMSPTLVTTSNAPSISTATPSKSPSSISPTNLPTIVPSFVPTLVPTQLPTNLPTVLPSTLLPTNLPSITPTASPTNVPTSTPTIQPSYYPTYSPSYSPTVFPTVTPSRSPTVVPTVSPTLLPSSLPSTIPTNLPSIAPSYLPTFKPTVLPSLQPTEIPTLSPSFLPTVLPTPLPSPFPTSSPTISPTYNPTNLPTLLPSVPPSYSPTVLPSYVPTLIPSYFPTQLPTLSPTQSPSNIPTFTPTLLPTNVPTKLPTEIPTIFPTVLPTVYPTAIPTNPPSASPTILPSNLPTVSPSELPSLNPTNSPSTYPTVHPSYSPTLHPTLLPSGFPTLSPTFLPSLYPSQLPTDSPTLYPTIMPTLIPSQVPTELPSSTPTLLPTNVPTKLPTEIPTIFPTVLPTTIPTNLPSASPTILPSSLPTVSPSELPSLNPTNSPSTYPTVHPSYSPTLHPTLLPSGFPTLSPTFLPSLYPSQLPTDSPTLYPTITPTLIPSQVPTELPTELPTDSPTLAPTDLPSAITTFIPSSSPSYSPSDSPSNDPTDYPTYLPNLLPSLKPSELLTTSPTILPSIFPSIPPTQLPTSSPSQVPTELPTDLPSTIPTFISSFLPSYSPSNDLTDYPTYLPTAIPSQIPSELTTTSPTILPSISPSQLPPSSPTEFPTDSPTVASTDLPSTIPTFISSFLPSSLPSNNPTDYPIYLPTVIPSQIPSELPTASTTILPSISPSIPPTQLPTSSPTLAPTDLPSTTQTFIPSFSPSYLPTNDPTDYPTYLPTVIPSQIPSVLSTISPTILPSISPSIPPSQIPTYSPSQVPTELPTDSPTLASTDLPSTIPTFIPSFSPSYSPSDSPSNDPTDYPTYLPTVIPSQKPSELPSTSPTILPSISPSTSPTHLPTSPPTQVPTEFPTSSPTFAPTDLPSTFISTLSPSLALPVNIPTVLPTLSPSDFPTQLLTKSPLTFPTESPSISPTELLPLLSTPSPTTTPTDSTTLFPTKVLTLSPSYTTSRPSYNPTAEPSNCPTTSPSVVKPTYVPSYIPSILPSNIPSIGPSINPSNYPAISPTHEPTNSPTYLPSTKPSDRPSKNPTSYPTSVPSFAPISPIMTTYPTFAPSVYPTKIPTSSPSFSIPVSINHLFIHPFSKTTVYANVSIITAPATVYCGAIPSNLINFQTISTTDIIIQQNFNYFTSTDGIVYINNLYPSTSYNILCTTISHSGTYLPISQSISSYTNMSTSCCKTISVNVLRASIYSATTTYNAITVSVDYPPSNSIQVMVSIKSKNDSTLGSTYPNTLYFTSSVYGIQYLTVYVPSTGVFTVNTTIYGISSNEYTVNYVNSYSIIATSSNIQPSVPNVKSAMFSSNGLNVYISFDSATNYGGFTNQFTCSNLLIFAGMNSTTCNWIDGLTISISNSQLLTLGSIIAIKQNKIKAFCSSEISSCSTWNTVPFTSVSITKPSTVVTPSVIIASPNKLGSCSSLLLDISTSTGSGGRPWINSTITVSSNNDNVTNLQSYLNSASFTIIPPSFIPSYYFISNSIYNFDIKLTNFLGKSGSNSIQIYTTDDILPNVLINGQNFRTMTTAAILQLSSTASIENCDGSTTSTNLIYSWIISSKNVILNNITSISKDSTMYIIPAFKLSPLTLYEITLTVTYALTQAQSSDSIDLYILQGNVNAVISGGSTQIFRSNSEIIVDASSSFDSDIANLYGKSAGLAFQWSCIQISPTFQTDCPFKFISTNTDEKLVLSSYETAINTTALITVLVYGSNGRSSNTSINAVVVGVYSPTLFLSTSASTSNFNYFSQLKLSGYLSLYRPCIATWSISDDNIDLPSVALTPTSTYVSKSSVIYLVLTNSALNYGSSYQFELSCGDSTTSITINTNSPPTPGSFVITPSSGLELSTVFTLSGNLWEDVDLPLTYQFNFLSTSVSSNNLPIQARSEKSYASTTLPVGNPYITCDLYVYDVLDSYSEVYSYVLVHSTDNSFNNLISYTQTKFMNSGNTDQTKQLISSVSTTINQVDCSQSPLCLAFNRNNCSSVANTCGSCLDGYIGDLGNSNTMCFSTSSLFVQDNIQSKAVTSFANGFSTTCVSDKECSLFFTCNPNTKTCERGSSVCPNQCTNTNQGRCIFVNANSGNELSTCLIGDISCNAVCKCDSGYGGIDCSYSTSELIYQKNLRELLLVYLFNVTSHENINTNTINTWSETLLSLSQNPNELTADSINTTLTIIDLILNSHIEFNLQCSIITSNAITNILDVILSSLYNYKLYNENIDFVYVSNRVLQLLYILSSIQLSNMVISQNYSNVIMNNYRFTSQIRSSNDIINISIPLSKNELLTNPIANSVYLSSKQVNSTNYQVNLISTSSKSYNQSYLNSNPISLSVFGSLKELDLITFQLTNNQPTHYLSPPDDSYNYTSVCQENVHEVRNFTCPDTNFNIVHRCNGKREYLFTPCPKESHEPQCSMRIDHIISTDCEVVNYTTSSTTCVCSIGSLTGESNNRKLMSEATGMIEIISYTNYVLTDVVTTTSDPTITSFNSIRLVVYIYSIFYGFGFLLLFYCYLLQSYHIKQNKTKLSIEIPENVYDNDKYNIEEFNYMYLHNYIPKIYLLDHKFKFYDILVQIYYNHRYLSIFINTQSILKKTSNKIVDSNSSSITDIALTNRDINGDKRKIDNKRIVNVIYFFSYYSILMFILVLFYEIHSSHQTTNTDCAIYTTNDSCTSKKLLFQPNQSICQWNSHANTCNYVPISLSIYVIMYITILVTICIALCTYPLNIMYNALLLPTRARRIDQVVRPKSSNITNNPLDGIIDDNFPERPKSNSNKSINIPNTIKSIKKQLSYKSNFSNNEEDELSSPISQHSPRGTSPRIGSPRPVSSPRSVWKMASNPRINGSPRIASSTTSPRSPPITSLFGNRRTYSNNSDFDDENSEYIQARTTTVHSNNVNVLTLHHSYNSEVHSNVRVPSFTKTNGISRRVSTSNNSNILTSKLSTNIKQILEEFVDELKGQRRLLTIEELNIYDSQWGLNYLDGSFLSATILSTYVPKYLCNCLPNYLSNYLSSQSNIQSKIFHTIIQTNCLSNELIDKYKYLNDDKINEYLFHLFMIDLLGGINTNKSNIYIKQLVNSPLDNNLNKSITIYNKIFILLCLILTNCLCIYYILLKLSKFSSNIQLIYLFNCFIQLLVEVFIVETIECIYIYYYLPSLITKDMKNNISILKSLIIQFCSGKISDFNNSYNTKYFFNMTKYFYLSTNISKEFPSNIQSNIITLYNNYLPNQTSHKWLNNKSKRTLNSYSSIISSIFVVLLDLVCILPNNIQKIILRLAQPLVLSISVLVYYIIICNPIYSGLLGFFVGFIIVYLFIRRHRKNNNLANESSDVVVSNSNSQVLPFNDNTYLNHEVGNRTASPVVRKPSLTKVPKKKNNKQVTINCNKKEDSIEIPTNDGLVPHNSKLTNNMPTRQTINFDNLVIETLDDISYFDIDDSESNRNGVKRFDCKNKQIDSDVESENDSNSNYAAIAPLNFDIIDNKFNQTNYLKYNDSESVLSSLVQSQTSIEEITTNSVIKINSMYSISDSSSEFTQD